MTRNPQRLPPKTRAPHHFPVEAKQSGQDALRPGIVNGTIIAPPGDPHPLPFIRKGDPLPIMEGKEGKRGSEGFGFPGQKGAKGDPGLMGPPGMDGSRGRDGADGTPGARGANGAAGSSGANGAPGPMGIIGERGPRGPEAWPTVPGAKGATGATGNQGAPGPMGLPGPSGPRGAEALSIPGAAGARGADGAPGAAGANGAPGASNDLGTGTVVLDFGTTPVYQGEVVIVDTRVGFGTHINVHASTLGTLSLDGDEAEVEPFDVYATQISAGQFTLSARPNVGPVSGKYKFVYEIVGGDVAVITKTISRAMMTDEGTTQGHYDIPTQLPLGAILLGVKFEVTTAWLGDGAAGGNMGESTELVNGFPINAGKDDGTNQDFSVVGTGKTSGATPYVAAQTAITLRFHVNGLTDFTLITQGVCTVSIYYLI